MANPATPELKLDGKNWKVFQESLLEAAATKGWLGTPSGQEPSDKTLQWEGRDAQPSELSVEPPMKERLKNRLTEARSKNEAEAAVGAAQQLHEQLSLRAVEPLKSEHIEVLEGMVKKPVKVEKLVEVKMLVKVQDINRKAMQHKRLIKEWRESAMLEGEWTEDLSFDVELTSGIKNSYNQVTNSQSFPTKDPNLTPTAHNEQANEDQVASNGGGKNIEPHHVKTKWIPMMGALLEGEQTRAHEHFESTGYMHKWLNQDHHDLEMNEGCVVRDVKRGITEGHGKPTDDKDNTMTSGDVDLEQVEEVLMAAESQDDSMRSSDPNIEEVESNSKLEISVEEGIGTSLDLTIKSWTLQEGPEVRGPRGQEEANKGLGVAEAKWKHQNDAGGVRMDGAMSSMCCDLKQVEMKLLAEDEAGQHQWQLYRPRNIPGPPTRL
ncbi:hypothetical protein BKA83DRAFT_4120826 [Pisolithus microcarpus]|nr:hypothetical protein BKA83DRAFT_4120826 [Pisolithus microcarpus]